MSDFKFKHLCALAGWSVLQIYFLAFHFSWLNVAVFAAMFLLVLFTTVLGPKPEKLHVVSTLPHLLGATLGAFLGYYFIGYLVPLSHELGHDNMFTMFVRGADDVMEVPFLFLGVLLCAACAAIRKFVALRPMVRQLLWYVAVYCVLFPVILATGGWACIFLYSCIALLFLCCDSLYYQQEDHPGKAAPRWFMILSILLLITIATNVETLAPFLTKGFAEYYFILRGFKWYTALLMLIVMAALAVAMCAGYEENRKSTLSDIHLFVNLSCLVIGAFFLTRFYVGYWWLLAGLYGVGIALSVTSLVPVRCATETEKIATWSLMPALTLLISVAAIMGHSGKLTISLINTVGIVGLPTAFVLMKFNTQSWKKKAIFFTVVLTWIWAAAMTALWFYRRLPFSFVLATGLYLMGLLFVWYLAYDCDLFGRSNLSVLGITAVAVAICCMVLCGKNGSKIDVEVQDNGHAVVDIVARGKENKVTNVQYFWTDSFLNKTGKGYPKEQPISDPNADRSENGKLRILTTDRYGVRTEKTVWIKEASPFN